MAEPRRQRARASRRLASVAAVFALAVTSTVITATPAFAATVGLDKTSSVETAQPGDEFTLHPGAALLGLSEAASTRLSPTLPPEIEVGGAGSTPSDTSLSTPATRELRIGVPDSAARAQPGRLRRPAGRLLAATSRSACASRPSSQLLDGTVITNTARINADNAPAVDGSDDVTVEVPRVVRPVATKSWTDGSAVAGSDEASTITLGVRNASSIDGSGDALWRSRKRRRTVFDRFNVTAIGPVSFPTGANRVTVLACTEILSACADGRLRGLARPNRTGSHPPIGVSPAQVTGLRFVFTNAAGTFIPNSPNGGTVEIDTVLRDTLRSTGQPTAPPSRDDVDNCAVAGGDDPELGLVTERSGVRDLRRAACACHHDGRQDFLRRLQRRLPAERAGG